MTFTMALWVLEQEKKWLEANTSNWPSFEDNEHFYMLIGIGALAQTSVIGSSPYTAMFKTLGVVEDYSWVRTAPQHKIKGFHVYESGKPVRADRFVRAKIMSGAYDIKPYGWATTRAGARRLLAARVATRFIPYVGWALFAYDVWNVGKWIGEKTSPW